MTFADVKIGDEVVTILGHIRSSQKIVATGKVVYIHTEHGWFMIDIGVFRTCTFGDNCYTPKAWKAMSPELKARRTRGADYE